MASTAPSMGAPANARASFTINNTNPFIYETAGEYVRAAHAVACFASVSREDDKDYHPASGLIAGMFDAVALLLSNADELLQRVGE